MELNLKQINDINLSELGDIITEQEFKQYFVSDGGREHYKLLAYFSTLFENEILLDIGYYRLGFYWNPFEINKKHEFINGTNFSDVLHLYYLDVDLRNLLLKYIKRIEINFRG